MDTLIQRLTQDFPDIQFSVSDRFMFTPPNSVFYPKTDNHQNPLLLLHELGHCLLKHQDYGSEITLLKMETQAWEKAKELANRYQIPWDEDVKDDYLDSYRDFLHRRSTCPLCQINGYYSEQDNSYHCPNCEKIWR